MRVTLLLPIVMLAAAVPPPVMGQATPSACWIRGSADRLAQRPSPLDSTAVEIDGAMVKVCYSRPSARGRQIFGSLESFGEPWRLGANEATTIHLPFAAELAGVRVGPGAYSLYAIPGESSWRIVVNREARRWGIPINEQVRAQDVGTGTVSVEQLNEPVETLTLRFAPPTGRATELVVEWERTRVRIPVRRAGG